MPIRKILRVYPSASHDFSVVASAIFLFMHRDRPGHRPGRAHPTRAGYVALVGLPNAGKSTLLNALAGARLSIVTNKAQTTWQRVTAVRTEGAVQMVLLDTPGVLDSPRLFHRSMVAEARGALLEADVVLAVVDGATGAPAVETRAFADFLAEARCPVAVAANKADHPRFDPRPARRLAERAGARAHPVSARKGTGLEALIGTLETHLPESPFLYPEDQIAAAPIRFFVAEYIRETAFDHFQQEIPYSVAVEVNEFRESEDPVYIAATVFVERKSQKGIVVGKGGAAIRSLGGAARRKIEYFLGARVYLDLWVKVWNDWRRKREGLMRFGYTVPDDRR